MIIIIVAGFAKSGIVRFDSDASPQHTFVALAVSPPLFGPRGPFSYKLINIEI